MMGAGDEKRSDKEMGYMVFKLVDSAHPSDVIVCWRFPIDCHTCLVCQIIVHRILYIGSKTKRMLTVSTSCILMEANIYHWLCVSLGFRFTKKNAWPILNNELLHYLWDKMRKEVSQPYLWIQDRDKKKRHLTTSQQRNCRLL